MVTERKDQTMTDKTVASGAGETAAGAEGTTERWYALSAEDVAQRWVWILPAVARQPRPMSC